MSEIHASHDPNIHHPGMIFSGGCWRSPEAYAARKASDRKRKRKARENPDYITRERSRDRVRKREMVERNGKYAQPVIRYPKPTNPVPMWEVLNALDKYVECDKDVEIILSFTEGRSRSMSFNDADEMLCQLGASHLWFQNPRLAQIYEEKAHLCS